MLHCPGEGGGGFLATAGVLAAAVAVPVALAAAGAVAVACVAAEAVAAAAMVAALVRKLRRPTWRPQRAPVYLPPGPALPAPPLVIEAPRRPVVYAEITGVKARVHRVQ